MKGERTPLQHSAEGPGLEEPCASLSVSPLYTATGTLYQDGRTTLCRAIRETDRCRVVFKVRDPRNCRPKDLDRLRHEYEIGSTLGLKAVVKPLALETFQGMPALVLEDFGGEPLDRLLGAPMTVERFLELAVRIAEDVEDIHREGIVHKDLKPQNILVNPVTGEAKITDFGIASRLPREQQAAQPPRLIEGSLPYMSPEQTGRMNRALDSRTDLYSLGVTFYEMLTGRLPFQARDPVEWVHCHVARVVPPLPAVAPHVPETIASIVTKLLAKMPEDRYQTARGLRHDLQQCLAQWTSSGKIEPFPLGRRDASERLQIPQKLYGRDEEIAALLRSFERVVERGSPELLLVSGYSGIGKSVLVNELHKPVVRERGFFVSGKFDQYKRDIPYSTMVQAFQDLVLEVLAESEERMAAWKQRLQTALGVNAQLIVDLIPQVELVIGKQPPVPALPPAEAQNRFNMVVRQFLGAFTAADHPVVLFLDDLQWADAASLHLLKHIITHPDTKYLFLIGAYRDNEVSPSHPLMLALDEVRKSGAIVHDIVLVPLSAHHLGRFIADALHRRPEEVESLARLVHERTAGNPFFVIQFMLALQDEQLVRLDANTGAFTWDTAKIEIKGFTDNVVDLLVSKLRRLPSRTQDALKLAASAGNRADIHTLSIISDLSRDQTHADLWEAVREGLLLRQGDVYRFLHDRVQQAAYSLIPEERRKEVHLRIGRLLISHTPKEHIEDQIFDIVNQLNLGSPLITDRSEKSKLAELNLIAGRRAKASAAYAGAARYFWGGVTLLGEGSWELDYKLTYDLHFELAQVEYLLGNRDRSQELIAPLLAHARDKIDKAAVYEFLVDLHTTQGDNEKAVDTALQCISLFGIELAAHPTREDVQQEYDKLWRNLGERQIEDLIDLPAMTDRGTQAALGALAAPTVAAMFTDLNLLLQLSCHMVNLCLHHGNADASVVGYVWLGITLGPVFGKYKEGYRFGKLAYDYVQKYRLVGLKPRIDICFGDLINFWTKPLQTDLRYLLEGFNAAVEIGDLTYACYCANHIVTVMITQGSPLDTIYRESEVRLDFVRKARYAPVVDEIVSMQRFVQNMRGLTAHFSTFDDATFDQRAFEEHLNREVRPLTVCWYFILKLAARFMSGDYAEAIEAAERARALLWSTPGHMQVPEYHYYRALSLAAAYGDAPLEKQREYLEALRSHDAQFREWADNCAENFSNKSALISAEVARITGSDFETMRLYERAIRSARENGFVQNEALAYELASKFYQARGFEAFADTYLREARACYARWGADGKVRHLERLHPQLRERRPLAPTATLAVRAEQLDLLSVVKASQSISSEILIEKLVGTLLQVVLEQGGAQRALLVLAHDGGDLSVEAEAILEENKVTTRILPSLPVESSPLVPMSIIRYARLSKEPVILSDAAARPEKFFSDPYVARQRPRSVLCLPIMRQASLVGLLYLENNLVAGAFTPERLVALSLLASQAAISMENARLLFQERVARHRSSFLAEAGALLSESLDYEETLPRLGRLCVQTLADWCVIDIAEGREIRRLSGAHADPSKEPLLERLRQCHPPRWDSPDPVARCLRSGEPILFPEFTDDLLRSVCEDDEHMALIRGLGTSSSVVVPLVARGQTLGVLSMGTSQPGRYGRPELELAQEVARRAAIAIDNARLYRETERAVRMRDEFLLVASHELRTPLASLTLCLQSLQRAEQLGQPVDPRVRSRSEGLAARQVDRLNRLIGDLLDVSRIEIGQLPLDLSNVELGALIRDVLERFEHNLARAGCGVSIQGDASVVGRWDRSRIDQVLTNLLSNAIKFGAGKPIEISFGLQAGTARIMVRDHGIGIDPVQQTRIFERFARAVSTRHYGGLGLGLYISRRIVEAHGGKIWVESQPGAGSAFTVELPCSSLGIAGQANGRQRC